MSRPDQRRQTVTIGGGESRQAQTVIAGIIIAATLLVGFFVVDAVADSVPATETNTVTNESFEVNFSQSEPFFYTVNDNGTDEEEGFLDDETVFNETNAQVTEGTDYEWFPANGTLKVFNTSAWQSDASEKTENGTITYTYDTHMDGFEETLNRVGDGLLIGAVVIIVLFAAVILRVLRGL